MTNDVQPDFGPDLQHPVDYLVGAVRLYGLEFVVGALCRAVEIATAEAVEAEREESSHGA